MFVVRKSKISFRHLGTWKGDIPFDDLLIKSSANNWGNAADASSSAAPPFNLFIDSGQDATANLSDTLHPLSGSDACKYPFAQSQLDELKQMCKTLLNANYKNSTMKPVLLMIGPSQPATPSKTVFIEVAKWVLGGLLREGSEMPVVSVQRLRDLATWSTANFQNKTINQDSLSSQAQKYAHFSQIVAALQEQQQPLIQTNGRNGFRQQQTNGFLADHAALMAKFLSPIGAIFPWLTESLKDKKETAPKESKQVMFVEGLAELLLCTPPQCQAAVGAWINRHVDGDQVLLLDGISAGRITTQTGNMANLPSAFSAFERLLAQVNRNQSILRQEPLPALRLLIDPKEKDPNSTNANSEQPTEPEDTCPRSTQFLDGILRVPLNYPLAVARDLGRSNKLAKATQTLRAQLDADETRWMTQDHLKRILDHLAKYNGHLGPFDLDLHCPATLDKLSGWAGQVPTESDCQRIAFLLSHKLADNIQAALLKVLLPTPKPSSSSGKKPILTSVQQQRCFLLIVIFCRFPVDEAEGAAKTKASSLLWNTSLNKHEQKLIPNIITPGTRTKTSPTLLKNNIQIHFLLIICFLHGKTCWRQSLKAWEAWQVSRKSCTT